MVQNQNTNRRLNMPKLESVNRISNFPIVESGINFAEKLYDRVKKSHTLLYWTLDQAEASLSNAIDTAAPAMFLIQGPLTTIDNIVCRSLDIVEDRVPQINLPPQMIYFNTKKYVNDVGTKIVKPVLKRADSVKQMGNTVLGNKYTVFAADKLDGALDVVDMYVDKYLPADKFDGPATNYKSQSNEGPTGKTLGAIKHVNRVSSKLRRRLTRRTLAEAKALKEQGAEAIHVLVYVAELILTDPKLALQKGRELWAALSNDEPENQDRPETLEQLIVMLTRESARRVVHFINFTRARVSKLPHHLTSTFNFITHRCISVLDAILKTIHFDGARKYITSDAKINTQNLTDMLKRLNTYATDILEQLAHILATKKDNSLNETKQNANNISPSSSSTSTTTFKASIQNSQPQNLVSLQPPSSENRDLKATRKYMDSENKSNGIELN